MPVLLRKSAIGSRPPRRRAADPYPGAMGDDLAARRTGGDRMLITRGRPLLGPSGRAWASGVLAGCTILVGLLGVLFAGQTRADGFDGAVDTSFIAFFAGHRDLLRWLLLLGDPIPAVLLSAAIATGCLIAGRLNGALLALTAVPAANGLTDGLLKSVFHRTYLGALVFPSGHTTAVVALTATLAVLLLIPPQRSSTRVARVLLVAIFCVASALVATALIALRWHYFTDTVAGAAVGVGTVCALALILDLVWDRASRHRAVTGAASKRQTRSAASPR
jgi:membrane-associated phospholipid phosphatase